MSWFLQDALLVGAFAYALWRNPRGFRAWLRMPGPLFLAAGLYIVVQLPFCVRPGPSTRELIKYLDVALAALALPALFDTRDKVTAAIHYSAAGITLVLAADLARLAACLGPRLLAEAHRFEPFAFTHSNLSAMLAGAACLALVHAAWALRPRPALVAAAAAGAALDLVYLVAIASRGPQLAFAVAVVLAGAVLLPRWRWKAAWLALAAVAAVALAANAERVNPRFAEHAAVRTFAGRDVVWRQTWNVLIPQAPVFGHGYGKRGFIRAYRRSHPPPSPFRFQHAHQYWLNVLFAYGWVGFTLHAAAWSLLLARLGQAMRRGGATPDRALPGLLVLLILFVHVFGLADWPASVVGVMLLWLIPLALVVIDSDARPADDLAPEASPR